MKSKAPSTRPARTRRTAEEARAEILDATERRLAATGPAGIRLQEVAEDVGVSHPTILHHFGSREKLVEEVIRRRVSGMNEEVLRALAAPATEEGVTSALFERLFEVFGPGGHARTIAFLALDPEARGLGFDGILPLAEAAHAAMVAQCPEGQEPPSLEDTYFTVMLVALSLFGEAIAGPMFRGEPNERRDRATGARFRAWLARLVEAHLQR